MIYHFDAYTLDSNRRELHGAGQAVPIEPRVFEVLLYLLEHRDRVVSKDELFEQCWPDTFVSVSALTHCMTKLRRTVRPLSGATEVIKTVHRQGYRFVADVRSVPAENRAPDPRPTAPLEAKPAAGVSGALATPPPGPPEPAGGPPMPPDSVAPLASRPEP